jgi:hypothetical protein
MLGLSVNYCFARGSVRSRPFGFIARLMLRKAATGSAKKETLPPTLSQRHHPVGEVAHGRRWEQEGKHATY